ncbi:DinB family protein [Streptomyces spiramenti]|uniref:DinB family protein n=1 Tax=Streptomyces spiramenti TaxID=2720606 RepID=A0ABX1ANP3_9ACTN|nr:DinB family protein [Streptomyces spiramenti]NJP68692.1 DinB family protein [Streptomyces spiramenti]
MESHADAARLALLRNQFDLTWALLEYHVDRLEEADVHWRPAPLCWGVRQDATGRWVPDWADSEPDPVPVPTVAWLTWHVDWWWTTASRLLRGEEPPAREAVVWAGSSAAAVARLAVLREEWSEALASLPPGGLDAEAPFPWPPGSDRTVADTVAWVTAELMKNAAEIGQLRLLRAAGARPTGG